MRNLIIQFIAILLVFVLGLIVLGFVITEFKSESNTSGFYYAGQILTPDYSHDDTLIVVNPGLLEKELKECIGSDYAIWYILHKNCAVLNQTIGDYQLNVNNFGYTVFDTQDTVSAEWESNDFERMVTNLNL